MLENFASECCLGHAMALKVANVRAYPGGTARQIAVADFAQHGIGMVLQSDTVHLTALRLQRLGHHDGKSSPASDEADFFSDCHAASFRSSASPPLSPASRITARCTSWS